MRFKQKFKNFDSFCGMQFHDITALRRFSFFYSNGLFAIFVKMLSAERGVMEQLEWDEGFAMPVADSSNMQLQRQVTDELNSVLKKGVRKYFAA